MSTIKINWGTKIAIGYIAFVGLIASLVIGTMKQRTDLVSSNYYEQELKYQDKIDAGKHQSELSAPISFIVEDTRVVLEFPRELNGKEITGTVQFYSPVQSNWDKTISIKASNNIFPVSRPVLHRTKYIVKVDWVTEGKNYYQESTLDLSKP
jgi:hypothetical protein